MKMIDVLTKLADGELKEGMLLKFIDEKYVAKQAVFEFSEGYFYHEEGLTLEEIYSLDADFLNKEVELVDRSEKKYKLLKNDTIIHSGKKLYRIQALKNFKDVETGDLGGYVEHEDNLSHDNNCWIYDNGKVFDNARVRENACVCGNAHICDKVQIHGHATVCGYVELSNNVEIYGNATVGGHVRAYDNAHVYGNSYVDGNADIYDNAHICGNSHVYDKAHVYGNAKISGHAYVYGYTDISDNAHICDDAHVCGNVCISDNAKVCGTARVDGKAEICGNALISNNNDYIVFKNTWSDGYFTYTRSNRMWKVEFFYGTGDELIQIAYEDSKNNGKHYELYVNLVREIEKLEVETI